MRTEATSHCGSANNERKGGRIDHYRGSQCWRCAACATDFGFVRGVGGRIGRAEGNALVLPDPDKFISRNHATIELRGGRYIIRDTGTATPVYVNGRELGNGGEAQLEVGDELRIGAYALRVKPGDASLLQPAVTATNKGSSAEDPLMLIEGAPGTNSDSNPFADLLAQTPNPDPSSQRHASMRSSARQSPSTERAIPDDFDAFANPLAAQVRGAPLPSSANSESNDLGLGLGLASAQSIDQLSTSAGRARTPIPSAPAIRLVSEWKNRTRPHVLIRWRR